MSSISKFFEKPLFNKMKNFFLNENTHSFTKKKSEDFDENSFGMVENPYEINENYFDRGILSKNPTNTETVLIPKSEKMESFSTISLYENEYADFIILEFGDSKIITIEEWREIFTKKSLHNVSHNNLYVSLQKGINFTIRKNLWPLLANIEKLINSEKKTYKDFCTENCEDEVLIRKDITRTYPDLQLFEKKTITKNEHDPFDYTTGQFRMFRVLKAYANYDKEIGYTQGMNFIVASLLYCLNPNNDKASLKEDYCVMDDFYEIKVFWIFVHIMQEKKWRDVFKDGTPKLLKMLEIFQKMIDDKLEKISKHFKKLDVDICGTFNQFFVTLLLYKTPINFSKKILDLFLLDGENAVYAILLKLLSLCEEDILKMNEFEEVFNFIRNDLVQSCLDKWKKNKNNNNFRNSKNPLDYSKINLCICKEFEKKSDEEK